jgi:hypothetical protein
MRKHRRIRIMHTISLAYLPRILSCSRNARTPINLKNSFRTNNKKQRHLASKKSCCVQNDKSTLPQGITFRTCPTSACHSCLVSRPSPYDVQRSIVRSLNQTTSRISTLLVASFKKVSGTRRSLLDFAIVIVVLEEADDAADTAGAEAVGRVTDCEMRCQY